MMKQVCDWSRSFKQNEIASLGFVTPETPYVAASSGLDLIGACIKNKASYQGKDLV